MKTEIKMTKLLFNLLEKIAIREFGIERLEARYWDGDDFKEVAVWEIEAALKAAYDAGYHAAERKAARQGKAEKQ